MANRKKTPGAKGAKVAQNLIATYGREKFLYLINAFATGVKGPEIAEVFGVTRQRVNQWKSKMGQEHVSYIPLPEVAEIIEGADALSTRTLA
jgi:hypothetical protein